MTKQLLSSLILLISIPTILLSQKYPFKTGKISMEEMEMDSCSFYPEANSMIIAKYGDLRFQYDSEAGWQYKMEVGVRKKIFSITDAADAGNIKIRAYEPDKGGSEEDINAIKAYSYNLKNGGIQEDKLSRRDVFKKRINDNWVEYSFAIPNVKAGSVVDYTYSVTSDYINNLTTWKFQEEVPVALSDFRYTIPEWFNYQSSQLGFNIFAQTEVENKRETFKISWSKIGLDGKLNRGSANLNSSSIFNRLVAKNVLPLEDEPYMTNKNSVPGRIEFQLVSTNFPNQPLNVIAGNYPKFNEELLKNNSFGIRLKRGRFIKDLEISSEEPLQQAAEVYDHIRNHFDWNEKYTFLSGDAGSSAYDDKEGNVADINLSLIAALREQGIEAYPIILSTRGSGIVHPIYPSYGDFNYVIAFVNVEGVGYFCDAASKLPFGQLPLRCRNGKGWLVSEQGGSWVDLKQGATYNHTSMVQIEVTADSMISRVKKKEEGYAALASINKIKKINKEKFIENLIAGYGNGQVSDIEISELNYAQPVEINYEVHQELGSSDIIYLETPTVGTISENPFMKENRFSPIDFAYQQNYRLFSTCTIPDGYTAELPESVVVKLPGDKGRFIYQLNQQGNTISVRSDILISETDFSPQDYPQLKQFYELIEKKHSEIIVLKKS